MEWAGFAGSDDESPGLPPGATLWGRLFGECRANGGHERDAHATGFIGFGLGLCPWGLFVVFRRRRGLGPWGRWSR